MDMTGIQGALSQIGSIFSGLFVTPDWRSMLDILIVAILVYALLRLFAHTRANSLIKGVLVVLVVTWFSEILQLNTLTWLLHQLLSTGVLMLIILFQPELRRGLSRLGRERALSRILNVGGGDVELQRRAVTEIVNALMELSRKRIGALIVIRRQTGLEDVLESGTRLDAEISAALLENIFEPNTPLHDGAVIVEDLRISAAACILQLTDDISLSRELGTRHRAAIGVTETTDAVTLIVSEETGTISTARDGRLTRYLDRKALTTLLTGLLVSEEIPLKQRIEGLLTRRKENKHEKD
jgi:diadenylate cyclase